MEDLNEKEKLLLKLFVKEELEDYDDLQADLKKYDPTGEYLKALIDKGYINGTWSIGQTGKIETQFLYQGSPHKLSDFALEALEIEK